MWWFATCDVMWCDVISCCPVLLSTTKYYSVLQSTTPVLLLCTTPVLQSTTRVLLRATKVLCQHNSVLQSTRKYYSSTTKYYASTTKCCASATQHHEVLLRTTPVLLQHNSVLLQYYKVLLQYYKVLRQYYSVLQSTTTKYYSSTTKYYASTTLYYKVLLRTTKYYASTTLYYKVLLQYYKVLQSTIQYYKLLRQYYKVLLQYYKVLLQVVSRPQKVTLELHQILRMSSKWLPCLILVTYETSFTMRGATGVTIQPHQILRLPHRMTRMLDRRHIWNVIYNARSNRCHHPTSPNTAPATQNDSHAWSSSHMKRHLQCAEQQVSPSNLTKYCACHTEWLACLIVVTYETSFTMRGATGVTIQPHQIPRLATKNDSHADRRHIWNIIVKYNVSRNRYLTIQTFTKYCACHEKCHLQDFKEILRLPRKGDTSFPMRADPSMIRPWSDHDPTMKTWTATPLASEVTSPSSLRAFSIVKYNVSRPILHWNLHQVLRLPRKVTLELHQVLHLPRKVTLELHHVLHLPRKVTLELHYSSLLDSTWLYSTWLYLTLLYLTLLDSTWLYLTLLDFYLTLVDSTWFYLTLVDSTLLYLTLLDSTWFYLTLLDSTLLDSTWLYSTLLDSTWFYLTLGWLYLILLDSSWLYSTRL